MVEGPPLHYYNYSPAKEQDRFEFFRPFEPFDDMEIREDLAVPGSPNSVQSDSDTSISSVEVPSQTIRSLEVETLQCRWRSCGIRFPSLDQLANHVTKVHSASGRGGLFYCGWEGCQRNEKGFNARYKMLVHVRTHTNEKPHKCFQCDKSFSRAENLKIHSRSHSGEKPYVCPVSGCNKAYSNSSDRFKHTRTHQVDKPYQCKVPGCPKRYTDPSSLRKHVKTYKHFVNEPKPLDVPKPEPMYRENVIRHPCGCNGMCCMANCIDKAADLFRIGAFIDLKNEENRWGGYVEPYATEREKMMSLSVSQGNWNGYALEKENGMNTSKWDGYIVTGMESMYRNSQAVDVDTPLDLSVHRKDF